MTGKDSVGLEALGVALVVQTGPWESGLVMALG
jgi:hypothetical protein